ncbi:MAG: acyltransferase [Armatimonadota bacterium]|nr:acyltransferase [Armatimonadota bacterium]
MTTTTTSAQDAPAEKLSWRIPAVDGTRALAMLMIFTYHMWEFGGSPSRNVSVAGYQLNPFGIFQRFPAGVDLFMVLSGFCLFLPVCKSPAALERWDWKSYAIRRVRRIVPPYYAAMVYVTVVPVVLVALFHLLHLQANWQPTPGAWQFFTHLFFIHTLFKHTWDGVNGSFWSLGLEAQFYLVFPLVILGFRRFNIRMIGIMIGLSLLYRVVVGLATVHGDFATQFLPSIFFLGRWMQFALGMAAALVVAKHWKLQDWRSARWGTGLIAVCLGLYVIAVSDMPQLFIIFPVRDLLLALAFAGFIIAVCISGTPIRLLVTNRAATGLGFISYSIFLIHQPTAWYISELLKKKAHVGGIADFMLLCTVGLAIIVGVAYLFFSLFERPFLTSGPKMGRLMPYRPGSLRYRVEKVFERGSLAAEGAGGESGSVLR